MSEELAAETATEDQVTEATEAEENTSETEGQDADQVTEGEETSEDDDKPKKETAKERRERDKAYKQRLREDAESARKEAEAAEARRAKILDAGKAEVAPKESDFQDYSEFVAAKAVWMYQNKAAQRDADDALSQAEQARARAQAIQQEEDQIITQTWNAQVADAKSRYADFDAVAYDQSVPINEDMAKVIRTSDVGPDLAYYLGKNKAVAADIAHMTPLDAARALGRIEATLSAPSPRKQSAAPTPITPVKPKAAAGSLDPSKLSMAEYKAARMSGKLK